MRDVIDDEGRKIRAPSVLACAALALLSIAVIYNSLFAQPGGNRAGLLPHGATRLEVAAGKTIQLRYDPAAEEVQRQLLASGYYKGAVDGVVGKRTRQAIEAYQKAVGLEVTGEPSPALAEHIRYTRQIAEASLFTGTLEQDSDAAARAHIRRVQAGLAELAYNPGEISGEMNDQTRMAIKRFQRDRGLDESGEISGALVAELSKMSGQSALNID